MVAHARDDAEAKTEDGFDGEGVEGELRGRWEGSRHDGRDLLAVERGAEVEGEDSLEVQQVLHPEGLVQVVLGADLRGGGLGEAAVATECGDGVTWHQVDHREDQKGGSEEDRDGLEESPSDVAEHGQSFRFMLREGRGAAPDRAPRWGRGNLCVPS